MTKNEYLKNINDPENGISLMQLISCLNDSQDDAESFSDESLPSIDWEKVVQTAIHHSLAPLFYIKSQQKGISLPDNVLKKIKVLYTNNTARNLIIYQELAKTIQNLQTADIPVIVLKGAYLSQRIYGHIGFRSMVDIDLLVKIEDLQKADHILRSSGYRSLEVKPEIWENNHHFNYRIPESDLPLEVHWQLVNANIHISMDISEIWSRAEPILLSGEKCFALSIEDQLLYLCIHCGLHTQNLKLRMLLDIHEFIRCNETLDWKQVEHRALEWGIIHPVYTFLKITKELFDTDIPDVVLGAMKPDSFQEEYIAIVFQQLILTGEYGEEIPSRYLGLMSDEQDLGKKWKILRNRLFPSRKSMAFRYPASEKSWKILRYYPIRWLSLINRYGRHLWLMIRSDSKTLTSAKTIGQGEVLFTWFFPNLIRSDRDI